MNSSPGKPARRTAEGETPWKWHSPDLTARAGAEACRNPDGREESLPGSRGGWREGGFIRKKGVTVLPPQLCSAHKLGCFSDREKKKKKAKSTWIKKGKASCFRYAHSQTWCVPLSFFAVKGQCGHFLTLPSFNMTFTFNLQTSPFPSSPPECRKTKTVQNLPKTNIQVRWIRKRSGCQLPGDQVFYLVFYTRREKIPQLNIS